jgi:UDP:flavonoid glycosyltransferase YjiC (YdhE family)
MTRLLMAWEMGGGMGHLDRMLAVGRVLRARGHEVGFALRDLARSHARIAAQGFEILQAPVWLPPLSNPPRLGNYAAVLAAAGWLSAPGLAALLQAWEGLYRHWRADAVLGDHAPTAVLAARGAGRPHWLLGNSFQVPPLGVHFPPMAHWLPGVEAECGAWDARVLAPANEALALLGRPPLGRLPELFSAARRAVLALPELMHYPQPEPGVPALGPVFVDDVGGPARWPEAEGPRVFVYLAPSHETFQPLVRALQAAGAVGLVHAKGVSPAAATRLGGARVRIEPEPVRMADALCSVDLVVSHASIGTVSAALLAGVPQLVLPRQMEQAMVARRVEQAGIGLQLPLGDTASDLPALLQRLLGEPGWRERSAALAARHAGTRPEQTAVRVADFIESGLAP